jgi:hypothetical protein
MSSPSTILALATAATIAAAGLVPTSASANMPMGVSVKSNPVMGVVVKPNPVFGVVVHPNPVFGVVVHPPGLIAHPPGLVVNPPGLVVNPPHPIRGVVVHHPDPDPDWDPPHIWWHHHHRPWLIEDDATRVSAPITTVPTGPCTCLTKKYLEDGSVLFKDVCTKEAAVATPEELKAQMQGTGP